jgi:hypothetical protein
VLLASLALLVVAPRMLAPLAGARLAWLWAWLLAVSPMLAIYGRMVRSYSVTLALTTCAVLAFARYWHSGERRFAAGYVVCGALAVFFHLGAGPFAAAPLGVALAALGLAALGLEAARPLPGVRGLALCAVSLALAVAALLAPGASSLRALVEVKSGIGGLDLEIAGQVARLHAGSSGWLVAGLFWLLAFAGPLALWQRGVRSLALLVPGTWLGQGLGLLLLAPQLDSPTLATRAFLVTLPMSLLGVAAGTDAALGRLGWTTGRSRTLGLASMGLVALLAGPYRDPGFWGTSFRQHDDYIIFTNARPALPRDALPAYYRKLETEPGGALVELPWHPFWGFGHAVPAYQEHHGRAVWVANAEPLARASAVRLRRYVLADPGALLATGARYAVVHYDLEREESAARAARGRPDDTRPHPKIWAALRREAERVRRELDSLWGPPDYDDGVVAVWDLARIRAS